MVRSNPGQTGVGEKMDANHDAVAFAQTDGQTRDQDGQDSRDSDTFGEFSASTTLHGLRYIGDNTHFLPRRLLWLLLVLLCGTLFAGQVVDRVLYYLDSPITVNFKVNYNTTVPFPAITICNQNIFRVSKAYGSNWLRFIESMYGDGANHKHSRSRQFNAKESMPVTALFEEMAHKKEDFIVRCLWANEECSAENFTVTLTTHGVCYTFNKVTYPHQALHVHKSGVEHALRLTLNTEQYERMAGPHSTTGIKMLASDQSKIPSVTEVGLAISTGTHAFVGLGVITINNLPPPHGECGETKLQSTERYTQESCLLECKTNYTVKECQCRHFYMPELKNKARVCTVEEYLTCVKDALKRFNDVSDTLCYCPTPCFYNIYEPSVSYATSSNMKTTIKEAVDESHYRDRYYEAQEIKNKIDEEIQKEFSKTIHELHHGFRKLGSVLQADITNVIRQHNSALMDLGRETSDALRKQTRTLDFQMFIVQKDFMRGRDAMEEKALGVVCHGFNEFVNDIENKLSYLIENNVDQTEINILRMLVQSSLKNKMDAVIRTKSNYSQLHDAYRNGEVIFNFTYKDYSWADHSAVIPRKLLNDSFTDTDIADNSFLQVEDIDIIITTINNYENYVYRRNSSSSFREVEINKLSLDFCQACENYLGKKSMFYSEVIDRPIRILDKRMQTFIDLEKEYKAMNTELSNNILFLRQAQEAVQKAMPGLQRAFKEALNYVNSEYGKQVTKYTIAKSLTEESIVNDIIKVKNFIQDLDSRGNEISESWTTLEAKILEIWKEIASDKDSVEYFRHMGYYKLQKSYRDRELEVKHAVRSVRDRYDMRRLMEKIDNTLMPRVQGLIDELTEYKNGHILDEAFYKENFLQMDVYFKELRSEQIDQQIAYDEFALMCDIGGSMGLFIGGSVLTFFEIIDCLLVCTLSRALNRRK